jgi:hypothetical protein
MWVAVDGRFLPRIKRVTYRFGAVVSMARKADLTRPPEAT